MPDGSRRGGAASMTAPKRAGKPVGMGTPRKRFQPDEVAYAPRGRAMTDLWTPYHARARAAQRRRLAMLIGAGLALVAFGYVTGCAVGV